MGEGVFTRRRDCLPCPGLSGKRLRLVGGAARRGAFLSPRWERNQRIARGTFRMVPRGPSSRQWGKPRGGFPHWILLPGDERRDPRSSRQSGGFDGKRSNRALARFPGSFAYRENDACEICDDEGFLWRLSFPDEKKPGCRRRSNENTCKNDPRYRRPARGRARRSGISSAPRRSPAATAEKTCAIRGSYGIISY